MHFLEPLTILHHVWNNLSLKPIRIINHTNSRPIWIRTCEKRYHWKKVRHDSLSSYCPKNDHLVNTTFFIYKWKYRILKNQQKIPFFAWIIFLGLLNRDMGDFTMDNLFWKILKEVEYFPSIWKSFWRLKKNFWSFRFS